MMLLFTLAFLFLGLMLITTLFNSALGPFLRKGRLVSEGPLVSVLVPARNEGHNIQACLSGLSAQSYQNLEILVLDDESEDDTAECVKEMQKQDKRIRLIKGKPLPDGWIGKNWACHQLSEQAGGAYLIFTDADNRHHPEAVARTLGWMQQLKLDGFSAFPQQITNTLFEKLIIPMIDLLIYGMLPLWLTYYSRIPSLAAANGQWLAFTRPCYDHLGGHAAIANEVVEDVSLARLLKKKRFRMLTTAGTGMIRARMYQSAREVWEGLSKSLFGLVNYSLLLFLVIGFLLLISMVAPYGLIFNVDWFPLAASLILMNLILRAILSIRFRHDLIISIPGHPIAVLSLLVLGINSIFLIHTGRVIWKGRKIGRRKSSDCTQCPDKKSNSSLKAF